MDYFCQNQYFNVGKTVIFRKIDNLRCYIKYTYTYITPEVRMCDFWGLQIYTCQMGYCSVNYFTSF